jgi:hypothetical protein
MKLLADVKDVFGTITPPAPIANYLGATDKTGGAAINAFLSNLIALIYAISAIVVVLMLVWGAFDWIISEGNKEKVQAAQHKIFNAVIGIALLAVAFAILTIIGQFTGFEFFKDQNSLFKQTNQKNADENRKNTNENAKRLPDGQGTY